MQYSEEVPLVDRLLRALAPPLLAERPVDFGRLPAYRAEHFPESGPRAWLDRAEAHPASLSDEERHWAEAGYLILPRLIPHELLDAAWQRYEAAIRNKRIQLAPEPAGEGDPWPGRFLNPHRRVGPFSQVAKHPALLGWLARLLGHHVKLLQTIASHKGSQQPPHSDSIHMTTYPLGYLAAAWIACEDIHADAGPLEFYPGSHRLPYVFSHHLGISVDDMKSDGYATYRARYEPLVQTLIRDHALQPHYFEARKGDVLLWHANLLHGGSPRRDLQRSRRALVGHYFARGAFVYHDLSATASRQQYF